MENPEKEVNAANATLNRLIAGDFLESLGKELGLEVPPDLPPSSNKARNPSHKEVFHVNDMRNSTAPQFTREDKSLEIKEPVQNLSGGGEKYAGNDSPQKRSDGCNFDSMPQNEGEMRNLSDRPDSSPSEEERSRKGSGRHRYSSSSDSDLSGERHYSSSKRRKKESSREREKRSSRRKHSKHRKHRDRGSLERSQHRSKRERAESKRDKRR